ncbi:HAMP domain-containing sensor histidine kinase [Chryseolinea sp. H1M3-3]|uniref:PAS domain-containing sensor histidine kinase n=1 Tax=Chryseolinea sp. H1M3-3 TaxID=3034144 RepID=UPI0023EB4EAE|nr:HAMP domain-containing sensor histidine kinase [Chryseolinea sp. H1M3-3]
MQVNRFDRLGVGLILVLGIFFLEYFGHLGNISYLIVALYLLRYTGAFRHVIYLGVISTIAILTGHFITHNSSDFNSLINPLLSLSLPWLAVYANSRFKKYDKDQMVKRELIQSLTIQKDDALKKLESVSGNLLRQVDEKRLIEKELVKRKTLQEAMAHNFPDGVICVLNTDMKFILADGGEIKELGLARNSKKSENTALNLAGIPELQNAFKGEQVSMEIKINNKSYTLNAVPIPDTNRVINEVLVVIRNITDQKNLENNLIKALEREKELNALKSQFVTMASHKFRTPLSTILSSVFLLENYTDADYELEKTAFFDKIKRSVHNLTALLNDYLSLGKLEEGKLKVTYTETNVKAFFDEFLQEIGSIKKVKQKIHFTHDGIDCTVMTDKFLLKNILTNLLSNAIEYSPHDAEIQLSAELKKDTLKIRVTDQGIGIPENEQHQIFKRFYRGQNANNVEGTGLGLNIAKKYIRLLKGTIEFTSQLNKGTTFIAIIPVMNINVLEKQA